MTGMTRRKTLLQLAKTALLLVRYNFKIIFAGRFIYFLLAALAFFLLVTIVTMFSDTNPSVGTVYYLILFPGILLIFYPATFGIQNDTESRMIEILFAIPNYRYKVWLVRMAMISLMVFLILCVLAMFCGLALVWVPVFEMAFQLLFPVFFLGCLAFLLSTLIRNGNGTAVVMVIIGMGFWISSDFLESSKWNIFLNPFRIPEQMNDIIWEGVILNNRIYLSAGSLLALLWGLLNLQKREKFIQ